MLSKVMLGFSMVVNEKFIPKTICKKRKPNEIAKVNLSADMILKTNSLSFKHSEINIWQNKIMGKNLKIPKIEFETKLEFKAPNKNTITI